MNHKVVCNVKAALSTMKFRVFSDLNFCKRNVTLIYRDDFMFYLLKISFLAAKFALGRDKIILYITSKIYN